MSGFEDTDLMTVWGDANCSDHPQTSVTDEELEGVETVLARQEIADWDNCAYAVGKLKDGRYIAIEEWEDSSGHGCQCGGTSAVYDTLEEALRLGLGQSVREDAEERLKEGK